MQKFFKQANHEYYGKDPINLMISSTNKKGILYRKALFDSFPVLKDAGQK